MHWPLDLWIEWLFPGGGKWWKILLSKIITATSTTMSLWLVRDNENPSRLVHVHHVILNLMRSAPHNSRTERIPSVKVLKYEISHDFGRHMNGYCDSALIGRCYATAVPTLSFSQPRWTTRTRALEQRNAARFMNFESFISNFKCLLVVTKIVSRSQR